MAQAQLLIRANDPIYEMMMPLGLHRVEDRTWQHSLRNVAAHFGASGGVETRVICVDPKRQWRRYGNIRYNALLRSALHAMIAPLRRVQRSDKRRQATDLGHRPEGPKQDARNPQKGGTP